jgi:hypothetical protein
MTDFPLTKPADSLAVWAQQEYAACCNAGIPFAAHHNNEVWHYYYKTDRLVSYRVSRYTNTIEPIK